MSVYVPTDWVDGVTPVNAANMDKLEGGVAGSVQKPGSMAANEIPVWNGSAWVRSSQLAVALALAPFGITLGGDVTLYRSNPQMLSVHTDLWAEGSVYPQGGMVATGAVIAYNGNSFWQTQIGWDSVMPGPGISFSSAKDASIFRAAANALKTPGLLSVGGNLNFGLDQTAGNGIIYTSVTGDSNWRWYVLNTGAIYWGPGNAGAEHVLYRYDANGMAFNKALRVGGGLVVDNNNENSRLYFGTALDASMYRYAAGILAVTNLRVDGEFDAVSGRLGQVAKSITDWNNALDNGWYMGGGGTLNAPAALTGWGIGEVIAHGAAGYRTQRVFDFTAGVGSQVYERRQQGGTWLGWVKVGLYNRAASVVKTDYDLEAAGQVFSMVGAAQQIQLANDGVVYLGLAQDTNLYRAGANWLHTDDKFGVGGSDLTVYKDAYIDYLGSGKKLFFGSAADVNLYRSAADTLKTDDTLDVAALKIAGVPFSGGADFLVAPVQLAATAARIDVDSIPGGYETLIIEFELVATGGDSATTAITFDLHPGAGSDGFLLAAYGQNGTGGTGVEAGVSITKIKLGTMKTHSVFGQPTTMFGVIEISGYTRTNFRKGLRYQVLTRTDQAGTNNDVNLVMGMAYKPQTTGSHALYTGAVTGFEIIATGQVLGIGSRVTVRGAGK
jgi:hypothetical protein